MYKRFEYNHRNDTRKKPHIHAYKKRSGKAHFQMLFWESPFPAAMFPRNWRLQRSAERNPENILTRIQSNSNKFYKHYILQYSRNTLQNPSPGSFRYSTALLLYINIYIFSLMQIILWSLLELHPRFVWVLHTSCQWLQELMDKSLLLTLYSG